MAAPKEITTKNLTGKFYLNKTLSGETDDILAMQGISWLTRTAIAMATITLSVKHYKDDDGIEHVDIDQTATGGIKGTTENRTLDWRERPHEDYLFGKLMGKSRRLKPSEVEDEFLKCGFLHEVEEDGAIEAFVINEDKKWSAHLTWGFEEINEIRYYVRHLKFTKTDTEQVINRKLVYDYAGPQ